MFVWLRPVVSDRLTLVHRRHLATVKRDAGRKVLFYRDPLPRACSAALALMLPGGRTAPSNAAFWAGQILLAQEAVNLLESLDQEEVAALRHFE